MEGFIFDVFKVQMITSDTNEVFATTTLQNAQIQRQLQETEVRGGVGNKLLAQLYHTPSHTIQLEHTKFAYDWLARQIGSTITTGAGTAWKFLDSYKVASAKVSLPETPTAVGDVIVKNASGQPVTGFTLSGKDLDFTAATPKVTDGDELQITYQYSTDPQTQTIVMDDSKFPKGAKLILETLEYDGNNNPLALIQVEYYSVVPDGQFTLNTQAQRQAVTQQMNLKVVSVDGDVVGEIRRIPVQTTP
jgi:hypothetical protein